MKASRMVLCAAVLFAICLMLPTAATADAISTIGPSCGSCYGGTYTLKFVGPNSGSSFAVTLTIVTPSSGVAAGDYVSSVEFGDSKGFTSAGLSIAPGGTGAWGSTVYGNLNNAGCHAGPAPNACNNQNLTGGQFTQALANGSTYSWTWNVVFSSPGLDFTNGDIHIGLKYTDKNNTTNGLIVSESPALTPSTSVPEPAGLALLGSGLLSVGGFVRRRIAAGK